MRISALDGRRVALWGWGSEGRAAYRAIRDRLPALALTLFCGDDESDDARALGDPRLTIETVASAERLSAFEIVLKSPGISPYRAEAVIAAGQGTQFIGGTALWFGEHAGADGVAAGTVCVTGTKGKSTTSSLLAHLLRMAGHRTALAGNIGLPLLALPEAPPAPAYWAIELSSYQTGDVAASGVRPEVAIALNVFPEHLDWHGSQQRYVEDKLRLLTGARPRIAVLNANDQTLAALSLPDSDVRWFGREDGWHLRGDVLWRGSEEVMDTASLPLPGRHNRSNLCAVLTAIEALGLDARPLAAHAATFQPLPHRLQWLGMRDGIGFVNDSISTTPHASLAALDCFRGRRVAILVGGHDRGIDWDAFVAAMRIEAPVAIITMGQNGPRILEQLAPIAAQSGFLLSPAVDLADAMRQGCEALAGEVVPGATEGDPAHAPVLLMSPGAPSYGPYRGFVERGRHFAQLAGFDPDAINTIAGIGIA